MLCEICHKRSAKVFYTEIINGVKKEQHICEECASNYTSFQIENPMLSSEYSLSGLLSTLLQGYTKNEASISGHRLPNLRCSKCGLTYREFLQRGRFGCSECFTSFRGELGTSLKGIQGADAHIGKRPKDFIEHKQTASPGLSEIEILSKQLQEAVNKEEYEEAARLRDLIRAKKKEESGNA